MSSTKHSRRWPEDMRRKKQRVLERVNDDIPVKDRKLVIGKIFTAAGKGGTEGEFDTFALASTMLDALQNDPDRTTGRQVREGGRYGASVTNSGSRERRRQWQIRAEEIWEKNPGLTKSAVAALIAKDTGNSRNTIRQVIRKAISKS